MSFTLLPAVDVAGGRSVRLVGGDADTGTEHRDPLDAALGWQRDGAAWIHLVDLDAAFGRGSNADLLASVIDRVDVSVELAGGICDDAALDRALATGCARVVLATAAVDDLAWCSRAIAAHGERIAIGLDVRIAENPDGSMHHRLVGRGSTRDSGDLWEVIAELDRAGCSRYVITDVGTDGRLSGTNVELCQAVARATDAAVIVSGGIASIDDLVALADVAESMPNLEGSIVGKALYAGRFTLQDALAAVRRISATGP